MARLLPANADFDRELSRLGSPEDLSGLRRGIESALAAGPGTLADPAECPMLGYYFTFSSEQFLAYFLTPGRFVRYEVAGGRSLTVTVPIDRLSRVVEEAGPEELVVTVELDADASTGTLEGQSETRTGAQADGPITFGLGRGVLRTTRTVYLLQATEPTDVMSLATFSRSLRASLGV